MSKRIIQAFLAAMTIIAIAWFPVKSFLVERYGVSEITVGVDLLLQRMNFRDDPFAESTIASTAGDQVEIQPDAITLTSVIKPFAQIGDRLGDRATGSEFNSLRGVTVFDANGDNLPDLYFPHSGRPITKSVDANNVLSDELMPAKPNALFLNQGNDDEGNPIFSSVQDLLEKGNGQNQREELLIEGKYKPRNSVAEDEFAVGRIASGAVSADFNGDGRLDLYVLNSHYGLSYQDARFGLPAYPARDNLGRDERREPVVLRTPSYLWVPMEDGLKVTVDFGEKPEPEGRNTLYLNMGDSDGDGVPEWRDVTDETGVGGKWSSGAAAVVDYDRDGDLDLYVTNFYDPDYWGFGTDRFGGQRNQFYVNQLSETGTLSFVESAEDLKIAGLHDEEGLSSTMFFSDQGKEIEISELIVDGEMIGDKADHSWGVIFSDWNEDGWPDLVVGNDVGNRLRVYENLQGKGFKHIDAFNDMTWDGCWMGLASGDLDQDGREEIFAANCGSQTMAVRNSQLFLEDGQKSNISTMASRSYGEQRNSLHNEILRYDPEEGFQRLATETTIIHSPYIPPNQSKIENFTQQYRDLYEDLNFANSLTSMEFTWNAPMFDVDNDGDLDMYLAGSLGRGNDNFIGDWSGSPGRMLVNESSPGNLTFRDMTLEYRLLDITHMDYESNPPRRRAPGTGWHKRDTIYLTDTDGYSGAGLGAAESKTLDIFRMHEAANGILSADLNNDGFMDLVVSHGGGYNSVSPAAKNLKVEFAGRILAVPAPNKVMKPPTNFEDGPTFVYINGGAPEGTTGNWFKLKLHDTSAFNRHGVGAKVIVNDTIVRRVRATQGAVFGASYDNLHVGLGVDDLQSLEIHWPSGNDTVQTVSIPAGKVNDLICVDRESGIIDCRKLEMAAVD